MSKPKTRKGLITKEGKRYGIAPHKASTDGHAVWVVIDTATMKIENGTYHANEAKAWEMADYCNAAYGK
jgi:hypothetical protein